MPRQTPHDSVQLYHSIYYTNNNDSIGKPINKMQTNIMLVLMALLIATVDLATSFKAIPKIRTRRQLSYLCDTLGPADFIRLTKEYLSNPSVDKLAEDYVFRGPVVGPLVKKVKSHH